MQNAKFRVCDDDLLIISMVVPYGTGCPVPNKYTQKFTGAVSAPVRCFRPFYNKTDICVGFLHKLADKV